MKIRFELDDVVPVKLQDFVSIPNLVTHFKETPIIKLYVVICGLRTDTKKTCV